MEKETGIGWSGFKMSLKSGCFLAYEFPRLTATGLVVDASGTFIH